MQRDIFGIGGRPGLCTSAIHSFGPRLGEFAGCIVPIVISVRRRIRAKELQFLLEEETPVIVPGLSPDCQKNQYDRRERKIKGGLLLQICHLTFVATRVVQRDSLRESGDCQFQKYTARIRLAFVNRSESTRREQISLEKSAIAGFVETLACTA